MLSVAFVKCTALIGGCREPADPIRSQADTELKGQQQHLLWKCSIPNESMCCVSMLAVPNAVVLGLIQQSLETAGCLNIHHATVLLAQQSWCKRSPADTLPASNTPS